MRWLSLSYLQMKPSQDRRQEATIRKANEGGAGRSGAWEQPEGREPSRGSAAPLDLSSPCSRDAQSPTAWGTRPQGTQGTQVGSSHLPGKTTGPLQRQELGWERGTGLLQAREGGRVIGLAPLMVTPAAPGREGSVLSCPIQSLGQLRAPYLLGSRERNQMAFGRSQGWGKGTRGAEMTHRVEGGAMPAGWCLSQPRAWATTAQPWLLGLILSWHEEGGSGLAPDS